MNQNYLKGATDCIFEICRCILGIFCILRSIFLFWKFSSFSKVFWAFSAFSEVFLKKILKFWIFFPEHLYKCRRCPKYLWKCKNVQNKQMPFKMQKIQKMPKVHLKFQTRKIVGLLQFSIFSKWKLQRYRFANTVESTTNHDDFYLWPIFILVDFLLWTIFLYRPLEIRAKFFKKSLVPQNLNKLLAHLVDIFKL